MRKIITLFQRNYETDRLVRNELTPGAEWVAAGEGVATRKFDGTCAMVRDGKLYKRYKQQGWVPVGDGPDDRWHREAWDDSFEMCISNGIGHVSGLEDGTYELCGPKVQGNPERFACHALVRHGSSTTRNATNTGGPVELPDVPRDFDGIKAFLATQDVEGIVWHHKDGRMVKIKKKDFGLKR